MSETKDKELLGNEKIEENIEKFLQNQTEEALANLLSSIRKQMDNGASFVVAIDPNFMTGMQIKEVVLKDGRSVGLIFTSFEEQMKGSKTISTFMVSMKQLFKAVLSNTMTQGLLLNAYGKAFVLDKTLIRLIVKE